MSISLSAKRNLLPRMIGFLIILAALLSFSLLSADTTRADADARITHVWLNDQEVDAIDITLGESFEIGVRGYNYGTAADAGSSIGISFPSFTNSTDYQYISEVSFTDPDIDVSLPQYRPGVDDIYFNCPTKTGLFSAEEFLVDSVDNDGWASGESNYVTLQVTPQSAGTFDIYIKVSTVESGSWRVWPDAANADTTDQQCEYVIRRTVNVLSVNPNLVVVNEDASESVVWPGDTIRGSAEVRNYGNADAGSSHLYYYISDDSTPPPVEYDTDYVSGISAGSTSSTEYSDYYTIPDYDRDQYNSWRGTRWLFFKADGAYEVDEGTAGGEDDNIESDTFTLDRPNINNVSIDPSSAYPGDKVQLGYDICNTDTSSREIGLGASIKLNGQDPGINDEPRDENQPVTTGCGWYYRDFYIDPSQTAGSYEVDFGLHRGALGSWDYMYYYEERPNYLTILEPKADLVVVDTGLDDTLLFPGDTFTAQARVRNDGSADAEFSYLYYYASHDDNPTPDEKLPGSDEVQSLTVDQTSSLETWNYTVPDYDIWGGDFSWEGAWYFYYQADGSNRIDEGDNENNNWADQTFEVARPTITSYGLSTDKALPGDRITFEYTICNPDSLSRPIGLGASLRLTGQFDVQENDESHDVAVDVPPGCHDYWRYFDIGVDVPVGSYHPSWGLHRGHPGATTYVYDYVEDEVNPTLSIENPATLRVFVRNYDNALWGPGVVVELYNEDWSEVVDTDTTDAVSMAIFPNLTSGNYNIQVLHTPSGQTPAAQELWERGPVSISPGGPPQDLDSVRSWPIVAVTEPDPVSVPPSNLAGNAVPIGIKVFNPQGGTYTARVHVIVDGDTVEPYDFEYDCTPSSYILNGDTPYTFDCTTPVITEEDTYYIYYRIEGQAPSGWVPTDQNNWGQSFAVYENLSTLEVTVSNVEGGNIAIPGSDGEIRLFDASWNWIETRSTTALNDGTGRGGATFNLSPGDYHITVYYNNGPWGVEYWGTKQITVLSGSNTETFQRDNPVGVDVVYRDPSTSQIIDGPLPLGSNVIAEVTVRNNLSYATSVGVQFLFDRDKLPSYDFDQLSSYVNVDSGQTHTFVFNLNSLQAGIYYRAIKVFSPDNSSLTDGWRWGPTGGALHVLSGDDSWPMYGYDKMNSHHTQASVPPVVTERWSQTIGDGSLPYQRLASPVIENGIAYIHGRLGKLYALDIDTGQQIWDYTPSGVYYSVSPHLSTPAVSDDVVVFGVSYQESFHHENSLLFALDANTGNLIWTHETVCPVYSSPVIENGVVYVHTCATVYALDLLGNGDGSTSEIWPHFRIYFGIDADTFAETTPIIVGDRLIVQYGGVDAEDGGYIGESGGLVAIDKANGSVIWNLQNRTGASGFSPIAVGNWVFFVESYVSYGFLPRLWAVDPYYEQSSEVRSLAWDVSGPLSTLGQYVIGRRWNSLVAYDSTGNLIWEHDAGSYVTSGIAVGRNALVYGISGRINALDVSNPDSPGEILWSHPVDGNMNWASPAIIDDGILLWTIYDNVYFLETPWCPSDNQAPELYWTSNPGYVDDGLEPEAGTTANTYRFEILYRDSDGDTPDFVNLHVFKDGAELPFSPYAMGYVSGSYDGGAVFSYDLTGLAPGDGYSYFFTARDNRGAQSEPTETKTGPEVSGPNTAPILSWLNESGYVSDGLDPESGGMLTTYAYRIKYSDSEGDPPEYVRLHILKGGAEYGGSPFDMTYAYGDFQTGAVYRLDVVGLNPGDDYSYYFEARDNQGNSAANTATLDAPDVNAPPYEPSNPTPVSGSTGVATSIILEWQGGDPEGDIVHYDVYLEANDSTPNDLVCIDVANTSCDPGILQPGTEYYWYVEAMDSHSSSKGETWSFTTAEVCYLLTVTHDGNGADPTPSPLKSPECSQNYYYVPGSTIQLSDANPDPDWHIAGWSGTDYDSSTATGNTVTMPSHNHQAKVIYEPDALTNIVINEVDPDTPDAIEFFNVGSQAVDMTGWHFLNYDENGNLYTTYIFPSFVLQPGAYVVVYESSGTDTATELYTGGNIYWNLSAGAAALTDDSGTGVDFMRWGSSSVVPPSGTGWSGVNPPAPSLVQTLGRDSASTDTDDGSDWCAQSPTLGTQNAGCGVFTISGYVRDQSATGMVDVTMTGLPGDPTTDNDGFYSAQVDNGWSGTVAPQKLGYTFSPTSRAYSNVTSDQTDQDYTGTALEPDIDVLPLVFDVTVAAGDELTRMLSIANVGGGTLTFQISDTEAGTAVPTSLDNVTVLGYGLASATSDRLEGLGATVDALMDPAALPSLINSYDVLYVFLNNIVDLAPYASTVDTYIQGGGGLVVEQPHQIGSVAIMPLGFEVYVTSGGYTSPSDAAFTAAASGHSLTQDLTPSDLSGNYDTIYVSDLGSGFTVLAVQQSQPDVVALAAGDYGGGRIVLHTGNLKPGAIDPGSDQYIEKMFTWAAGGSGAGDAPWLTETPASGTVAAGGSEAISVTFDAADLLMGTHTAYIIIANNDPDENPFTVPATLTVTVEGAVIINEVDPGTPDAIEFYNAGSQAVDMTGWQFQNYDQNGTHYATYTFPNFALQPSAYVVLYEYNGADTATELYTGGNIRWISSAGGAALLDNSGTGVDFVRWGNSTVNPPPGANWTGSNPAGPSSNQTLGRDSASTDTDDGGDWCPQIPSLGAQNADCGISPPTLSGLPDRVFTETTSLPSTIDLWAYAADAETAASGLTYTIEGTPPAGAGVTLTDNRTVTVDPSANWCGGTDVTVRATDPSGLSDSDTFRVAVTWSCPGPLDVPDQVAAQDQPITIDLAAYEPAGGDECTGLDWTVTGADHCTVSREYGDDDVLTFTPVAGFVGSDTTTLHAVDPGGNETAQDVTLTWIRANTAPSLSGLPDQVFDQTASLPATIDLWDYTSDDESSASELTYTLYNTPATGAGVSLEDNRTVTMDPSREWCGSTDVTVRVTDPDGLWDTDTFRVAVTWMCGGSCFTPGAPVLVAPSEGITITDRVPTFDWNVVADADEYQIQVDADLDFSSPEMDGTTTSTDYTPASGLSDGTYYWRVRASNTCDTGPWSAEWEFTIHAPPEIKTYLPMVNRDYQRLLKRR